MALLALLLTAAIPDLPQHYLMYGTIDSDDGSVPFVVGVTPQRAISGMVSQSGDAGFVYSGAHERRLQVGLDLDNPKTMQSPSGKVTALLLNNSPGGSTPDAQRAAVEMASFSRVPFALFFSCGYVGVTADQVGGKGTHRNNCGVLNVENSGGIQRITFEQQATDLLTVRLPDQTLDRTTHPFSAGLTKVWYETKFSPAFDGTQTSWTCDCLRERESKDGKVERSKSQVVVTSFTTELSAVEKGIDQFLQLIPEGEPVAAYDHDPLSYVWRDKKVALHLDKSAISVAADSEFRSGSNRRWLLLVLCVGVIGTLSFFWLRARASFSDK